MTVQLSVISTFVIEDHMLDWHSCQICYPLEIKILLLLNRPAQLQKLARAVKFRIKGVVVLYYVGSEQQRC